MFRRQAIRFSVQPGGSPAVVIVLVLALMAAFVSGKLVTGVDDFTKAVIISLALIVMVATFLDTNIGLIVILLSMLLSPELEAGATPGRAVVLRAEDLLLIVVSLTWLTKMAFQKQLPLVRSTPLNAPIGLYVALLCFSTVKGMITGNVIPLKGMFYVLKLVEYFILYFIVVNHVTTERQVRIFLGVLLFTSLIVGIYGNTHIGSGSRISAPFEGEGEPNTLGGYLLFILSIVGGIILHYRQKRPLYVILFLFLIPTFVFTLSRSSYMGLIATLFTFVTITADRRVVNSILIITAAIILFVSFGPEKVRRRVVDTFTPEAQQEVKKFGMLQLGPSPAARVISWKDTMTKAFPRKPIFGYGMTGIGFLDSQYILVLGETGLAGFAVFTWLFVRIWRTASRNYRELEDPLNKGLVLGYLAGLAGLLVQAIGTNTFIIIRIAEPFWFFTAIVVKLVDIETGKSQMEDLLRKSPLSYGGVS
ncbi:MAG: O-antigen ligase family protein [Candidatus Omnitrophica bacterium]|nr:O-antigen ligase family protein [Candidatus Omnitrophota bacterium]MDD4013186.1 O-antigen ligase family protein [Candidatus Omnitrophota bacterium]